MIKQKKGIELEFRAVDTLQRILADRVFQYAADRKKAAGRALGTLVEIVTYYTLCTWGFRDHIVIERSVPEFANPEILHNVEFSLHPIRTRHEVEVAPLSLPLTAAKVKHHLRFLADAPVKSTQILRKDGVKRNAAVLLENQVGPIVANLNALEASRCRLGVCQLVAAPFAILECKRVGVEEGMRKGPQTIEKAKQGAYVARSVSALQKVRLRNGKFHGIIERPDGSLRAGAYDEVLREAIEGPAVVELAGIILTVGVVSNHGNWFTSGDHNKELRVLAQSYDWLLFLTDGGLSQFIDGLLLDPEPKLAAARDAFLQSYSGHSKGTRFTKVSMGVDADRSLQRYFSDHRQEIDTWFNVISPGGGTVGTLRKDLWRLGTKVTRRTARNDSGSQK